MKKILLLLIIVVIFPVFTLVCSADDAVDRYISDFGSALPDGFSDLSDVDMLIDRAEVGSLISEIMTILSDERGGILSFFLTLIGSVGLMTVASLCHDRLSSTVEGVVGMIVSVLIFSSVSGLLGRVDSAIGEISSFFGSLIPIFVGVTAMGGGTSSAGVQAAGMYTALSAVGGIGSGIFISLSSFGLAMSLLSCFGSEGIGAVCKGLRGLFGWVSGIFTALITAAFSLQTLVASSADSAAMRAVKYAASGLIPVVGSTVSGAISTLATGLSYARGIIGGGAIVVILYMALAPLVLLLAYRLCLSCAIIFADFCGGSGSRIFTAYRFSIDMTVTLYALSTLIYLFEIIIITMVGVNL